MKIFNSRRNQKLLLVAILIVVFFTPQHQASANPFDPAEWLVDLGSVFISALGWLLEYVAKFMAEFIDPKNQEYYLNLPVVQDGWVIMRNFVNLFFILILIIMAFGTIFNSSKYSWQQLLVPFLIAAVFVNFSFAIGQYVISLANGLSAIFLKTIGSSDFGTRLANGLSIQKFYTTNTGGTANLAVLKPAGAIFGVITAMAFVIVFVLIAIVAFASALIFSIVRIPILWFLLILSPAAIVAYALPNARSMWDSWKKAFISWTFFLPTYLFFLMFAFIFVANKKTTPISSGASAENILAKIFGLEDLLFYVLTIIFMVGGLGMAMKTGSLISDGVGKAMGGIQNWTKKRFGVYEGVKKGLIAKKEDIQERGVPVGFGKRVFGGQGLRMREAKIAQFFGAKGEGEKQLNANIEKEKSRLGSISDINELRRLMDSGRVEQRLAAREILKSRDALSVNDQIKTYDLYRDQGANNTALKFARGIEFGRLSSEERKLLYDQIADPEIRRKILMTRAEKNDLRNIKEDELKNYVNLFVQEGDKKDFLTKVEKNNFETSVLVQANLGFVKKDGVVLSGNLAIAEKLRGKKLDDILELSKNTLNALLKNDETRAIIKGKLTKDSIAQIAGKVTADQFSELIEVLTEKKKEIETTELETEAKKAEVQGQAQTKALEPLISAMNNFINNLKK